MVMLALSPSTAMSRAAAACWACCKTFLPVSRWRRRIRNPHCTQAAQQCRLMALPENCPKDGGVRTFRSLQRQAVGSTRSSSRTGNAFFAVAISFALTVRGRAAANHLRRPSTGGFPMFRTLMIGAVSALTLSAAAFAQQQGEQEARAMLSKAVAAVKADRDVALAMFLKGAGRVLDRDLYPFCFRIADAKGLVGPKAVQAGTDVKTLKDANGDAYGQAIYAAAQKPEGEITAVGPYLFPKPGTLSPTFEKVSFVTKVGDLGCGVGYYK